VPLGSGTSSYQKPSPGPAGVYKHRSVRLPLLIQTAPGPTEFLKSRRPSSSSVSSVVLRRPPSSVAVRRPPSPSVLVRRRPSSSVVVRRRPSSVVRRRPSSSVVARRRPSSVVLRPSSVVVRRSSLSVVVRRRPLQFIVCCCFSFHIFTISILLSLCVVFYQ
jgi:hypothetical protein